jgi:hypothetical protein
MSSSHQPIYWDTAAHVLADPGAPGAASTYSITFPLGTTRFRIVNGHATHGAEIAGTLATITAVSGSMPLPPNIEYTCAGHAIFIRNRNNGQAIPIAVIWERIGRVPDNMNAGVATISSNLTP